MANELKHGSVGTELTQVEWEGVGTHVLASQATGDIIYATSSSQLSRLGIGSSNDILRVSGGVPDWQATTFITALGTIATGVWEGTDVGVAHGGTGASTLTANGVLIGNGTSAIASVDMSTKGKILIGDGSGNPQMLAVGTNDYVLTADSGETTGVKWAAAGNAATATALATARTIGGTSFDGTANIAVGLAATATALATGRTIGGTSFDGTANIAVGLAATATALASARTINGVSFDGTGNITVPSAAGTLTGSTLASGVVTTSVTTVGTIGTGVWQGTDVGVAYGGTGASTLTANGVLIGNGTSAISSVDMSTKGHILIGDGSGNPQMLAIGSNDEVLVADSGETTGVKWAAGGSGAVSAVANGADNRVTTFSSSTALNGEANLIFDGELGVGTDPSYPLHVSISKAGDWLASLDNTNADAYGLRIRHTNDSSDDNTNIFLQCSDGTATRLKIWSDGDVANHDGVYGTLSDSRIKQNVVNVNSQWDDIKALVFKNFKKKDDVAKYGEGSAPVHMGLIAQDLEATSPNLVSEYAADPESDGLVHDDFKVAGSTVKGIKYSILFMKATKALQEAMARVETLEAKVAVLEG